MSVISTQGFTFRLLAGDPLQQLDLFEDEDYVISNNVTGLFDIGTLPSDFTRQITLPGTKVNNAFFEHCYDISIVNPFIFATNQKVPALFEFDSVYLSSGYLQLNKVNVIANKFIDSYEVTIYGTLSSFGRDVNRLYLNDLNNLAVYNHTSSVANISASWGGNLFGGDIVYPIADYGTGLRFTSGNDYNGLNNNQGGLCVQDFKPAIRVKKVLDAIFEFTGYTYSSSFMNEAWWDDVYMICNYGLKYPVYANINLETYGIGKFGAVPSGSGNPGNTDLNLPDATITTLPWYNILENPSGLINQNGTYDTEIKTKLRGVLNLKFEISNSVNNLPTNWQFHYWTGSEQGTSYNVLIGINSYFEQLQLSRQGSIQQTFEVSEAITTADLDPNKTYYFGIRPYKYNVANAPTITLDPNNDNKSYFQIKKVAQGGDGLVMDIPSNMPYGTAGIKLVDFITGLQKKFNLIIQTDNTKQNHFIIEPFNTWYKSGEVKDFNKYINLDETIEVVPANNLAVNKLNFGDALDQDYISQQFYKGANREFGKIYYTDTTNFYSQGELNVKTTFGVAPLVKIAGTGASGSFGGGSTSYGTVYLGPGYSNDYAACYNTTYYPQTVYSLQQNIGNGSLLFTDPGLSSPFNGYNEYYKYFTLASPGNYYTIQISTSGEVISYPQNC